MAEALLGADRMTTEQMEVDLMGTDLMGVALMRAVPTTAACTWWNRQEEDLSSGKLE